MSIKLISIVINKKILEINKIIEIVWIQNWCFCLLEWSFLGWIPWKSQRTKQIWLTLVISLKNAKKPKIKNFLDKSYTKWRSLQEEVRKLRDDFIDQEEDGMVDYPPGIAAF